MQYQRDSRRRADHGVASIQAAFRSANRVKRAALMPYYTLGYPDQETSMRVVEAIAPLSDLLELGIPFSDPLADGPTIQRSTQVSLEQGTTTRSCLEMLDRLRERGVTTPVMLMGYYNPILAYGEEVFVREAAEAGADGFIVPDLPPEEAGGLEEAAAAAGLAFIHFLAPTSSQARLEMIAKRASGFIYLVSVAGVTGARAQVEDRLGEFVGRVRACTSLPLAVGFGISTPAQAAAVGSMADGVIVGSALIEAVNKADDKPAAARDFVRWLLEAMTQSRVS